MEISLRLDTLGLIDMSYLRGRERYRDWPQFRLLAASRQARVMAHMSRDIAEQLHQQVLAIEEAIGLDVEDGEEEVEEEGGGQNGGEGYREAETKQTEREPGAFSPAFAQALKQLNELARQRLPDAGTTGGHSGQELAAEAETTSDEEDALEQLQDAFIQMMEVVRELAEEMSTDALKITGRFKCARTNIEFVPQALGEENEDEDDDGEDEHEDGHMVEVEVELVMVLQLFEEGRAKPDDEPTIELQLDVDDFERLHETLDIALEQERKVRRRR